MTELQHLPPLIHNMCILLLVIAVKAITSQFSSSTTVSIYSLYLAKLADKVNKTENSAYQQKIAGFVGLTITLAPCIVILWLFENFIEVPEIWHFLLLFFALGPFNLKKTLKETADALQQGNKMKARQLLEPFTLREVGELSTMGMSKATIEAVWLKHVQQHIVIAGYYLLFGPIFAIAFRMVLEAHYLWNVKRQKFSAFGAFPNYVVKLLSWPFSRMFIVLYVISNTGRVVNKVNQLSFSHFFGFDNNYLVHVIACTSGIQLGGVAKYDGVKLRRPSFNPQGQQPQIVNLQQAASQLRLINIFFICLLMSVLVIGFIL